jgi:uncharacterized membrane protein
MRMRIPRSMAVAMTALAALVLFDAAPASAHRHWHRSNAAVLGAVLGVFGTIAAVAAANRYNDYDNYYAPYGYYGGPYYGGGPSFYIPHRRWHLGHGRGHWHGHWHRH